MANDYKRNNLGFISIVPELNNGEGIHELTASGGSTTTFTFDAGSAVANLYPSGGLASKFSNLLNGCQLYVKSGTEGSIVGKTYNITGCAWLANVLTLTVETMPATATLADVVAIIGKVKADASLPTIGKENITREGIMRDFLDKFPSCKGIDVVSGSFDVEASGLQNELGDGDSHVYDRWTHILEGYGSLKVVPGGTIQANWASGSTGTVTGTGNLSSGDLIKVNGEVRKISSVAVAANDTITVSKAFSSFPQATDVINGCEQFTAYDSGHRSFTIVYLVDDQKFELYGCLLNIALSATFAEKAMFAVDFDGDSYSISDGQSLKAEFLTGCPIIAIKGSGLFGSVEVGINNFEFNPNHTREESRDFQGSTLFNGGRRWAITGRDAQVSLSLRNQSQLPKTWEEDGTVDELLIQLGVEDKGTIAVFAQSAQVQDPSSLGDQNGFSYWDVVFGVTNDGSDDTVENRPIIARF